MSLEQFRSRIRRAQLHPNDLEWMPVWLLEYASFQSVRECEPLAVKANLALGFLRSLSDRGTPAWQRLQAVRAVEAPIGAGGWGWRLMGRERSPQAYARAEGK